MMRMASSTPPGAAMEKGPGTRWLRVANKCDLGSHPGFGDDAGWIRVSCRTGEGLEGLRGAMTDALGQSGAAMHAEEIAVSARHQDALRRATGAMSNALLSLREARPLDLAAADLRVAFNAVGEIVGRTTTEDLLDRIFGTFCIGK